MLQRDGTTAECELTSKHGKIMISYQTSQVLWRSSKRWLILYSSSASNISASWWLLNEVYLLRHWDHYIRNTLCRAKGSLFSSWTKSHFTFMLFSANWSHFSWVVSSAEPGSAALYLHLSPTEAHVSLTEVSNAALSLCWLDEHFPS